MELVNYADPPVVHYSTSSETCSTDSRRSTIRSVHFDQIHPTLTRSGNNVGDHKTSANVVTAKDGAPVYVQEHVIKSERKKKVIKAPIGGFAMGPWPVVNQPEDGPRTVYEKYLNVYIIASIVACVLFFPTGVPALMYAFKTKREFYAGIQTRGEVTQAAIKASRNCEKLLILTLICLALMGVIIFAVVEKLVNDRSGTTHSISNNG